MADLSTDHRKKLPDKDFGLPGERKYPMPDRSHAANAKARASEEEHKGHISKGEEEEIDRKANKKLGEGERGKMASALRSHGVEHPHPHGHHPVHKMAHPHGDGRIEVHAHGGFTHHHADGSVTHHDRAGQQLSAGPYTGGSHDFSHGGINSMYPRGPITGSMGGAG